MTVLEKDDLKASLEVAGITEQLAMIAMHVDEIEAEGERVLDLVIALRSAGRHADQVRAQDALVDLAVSLEHLCDHAAHLVPALQRRFGIGDA